jgi:predicted acetyltransferase
MPHVVVRRATDDDRELVARLWQLDRHDLSQFWGTRPGPDGLFRPEVVATFFTDPDRQAWIIEADGDIAGLTVTRVRDDGARSVFAFFVLRGLRRSGVGSQAAAQLIAESPGRWAIAFQEDNVGAAAFWRRVVRGLVGDAVREERETVPDRSLAQTWLFLDTSVSVPDRG